MRSALILVAAVFLGCPSQEAVLTVTPRHRTEKLGLTNTIAVTAEDEAGKAGSGTVRLTSSAGTLQAGESAELQTGEASFSLVCTSAEPACLGVVRLTAEWIHNGRTIAGSASVTMEADADGGAGTGGGGGGGGGANPQLAGKPILVGSSNPGGGADFLSLLESASTGTSTFGWLGEPSSAARPLLVGQGGEFYYFGYDAFAPDRTNTAFRWVPDPIAYKTDGNLIRPTNPRTNDEVISTPCLKYANRLQVMGPGKEFIWYCDGSATFRSDGGQIDVPDGGFLLWLGVDGTRLVNVRPIAPVELVVFFPDGGQVALGPTLSASQPVRVVDEGFLFVDSATCALTLVENAGQAVALGTYPPLPAPFAGSPCDVLGTGALGRDYTLYQQVSAAGISADSIVSRSLDGGTSVLYTEPAGAPPLFRARIYLRFGGVLTP